MANLVELLVFSRVVVMFNVGHLPTPSVLVSEMTSLAVVVVTDDFVAAGLDLSDISGTNARHTGMTIKTDEYNNTNGSTTTK